MQHVALILTVAVAAGYLMFAFTAEQLSPFVRPRSLRRRRRWALARGLGLALAAAIIALGIGTALDGSPALVGGTIVVVTSALVLPAARRFRRPTL